MWRPQSHLSVNGVHAQGKAAGVAPGGSLLLALPPVAEAHMVAVLRPARAPALHARIHRMISSFGCGLGRAMRRFQLERWPRHGAVIRRPDPFQRTGRFRLELGSR